MLVYILVGIDPYAQPGVNKIYRFDNRRALSLFLESWLRAHLEKQKDFVSGLRGDIESHIKNYINYAIKNNHLLFDGEFKTNPQQYEYMWSIHAL